MLGVLSIGVPGIYFNVIHSKHDMIQLMYTDLTFISSCIMFKISNPGRCVYMLAVQTMRSINR